MKLNRLIGILSILIQKDKATAAELAEKFEERQQEKEKGSLLKNLKDKQKESAAKPQAKDSAEKAIKSKERESL